MRTTILWMLIIAPLLSACASTSPTQEAPASTDVTQSQAVDPAQPNHRDRRSHAARHRPASHQHEDARHATRWNHLHSEPSSEEVYAATIAAALFAQVFACAFVEIILDGSCYGTIWIDAGY
ncbi:MAG: hypothetical protein ACR2Q4_20685 [Geminicoccaceae bacterium]